MEKTKDHRRIIVNIVCSVAALSAIFVTAYAQQTSQKGSRNDFVVSSKRSITAPSAGSKVTLQLTFDTGAVFRVTQFEGALIRIERNGTTIGLIANIDTNHGNEVKADIYRGLPSGARDLSIKGRRPDISSFDIGREISDLPIADFGVKVAVLGIAYEVRSTGEGEEISQVRLFGIPGELADSECCVTCSGIRVCGCSVEAPCGGCCVGSCCG